METGAITQYVDVAQLVLYAFWVFFFGLIYYLLRENHREGYPMNPDREHGPKMEGWPAIPSPKAYKLEDGRVVYSPDLNRPDGHFSAQPSNRFFGAPLDPVGNPLTAGLGPGAWAMREDVAETDPHGALKIVPLRASPKHGVSPNDTNPIGVPVIGADGKRAGTVKDLWVDRMEIYFRYIEVELPSGRVSLLPINFARIHKTHIEVNSILSTQFEGVPSLKSADSITRLEEEKICAYYGAGTLFATPERAEPLV
jgi:photosynthetic reaction center H subunit